MKNEFIPFILNKQVGRVYNNDRLQDDLASGFVKRVIKHPLTYVTQNGDVFNQDHTGRLIRSREFIINNRRNVQVYLHNMSKTTRPVATLVAETFIGEFEAKTYIGFLNDNPFDCRASNVCYKAGKEVYVNRKNLDSVIEFLVEHDSYYEGRDLFNGDGKFFEEMSEVLTAIQDKDPKSLCEELGDLLYHIKILCKLAEKENQFNYNDVEKAIANKMYDRHIAPKLHPENEF